MFSEELKRSTLTEHAELEKKLVSRIKKIATVKDYADLLKLMYGYYKPLQDRIGLYPREKSGGDDFSLRISDSILKDLEALGHKPDTGIPVCSLLPEITTAAASLGAMYVTEGSTLGGQIITKMISRQLNISGNRGFSFFNAYGEETPARWENFKGFLNRTADDQDKKETIETAKKTFSTFKEWVVQHERNQ